MKKLLFIEAHHRDSRGITAHGPYKTEEDRLAAAVELDNDDDVLFKVDAFPDNPDESDHVTVFSSQELGVKDADEDEDEKVYVVVFRAVMHAADEDEAVASVRTLIDDEAFEPEYVGLLEDKTGRRERLLAFESERNSPPRDEAYHAWNDDTKLILHAEFLEKFDLAGLFEKFLDGVAAGERGETANDQPEGDEDGD